MSDADWDRLVADAKRDLDAYEAGRDDVDKWVSRNGGDGDWRKWSRAFREWLEGPLAIHKAEMSLWYRAVSDIHAGMIRTGGSRWMLKYYVPDFAFGRPQVFLVQHDWAGMMTGHANADALSGEVRLPFENCCFEFNISQKRVLALVSERHQEPGSSRLLGMLFVQTEGGKWLPGGKGDDGQHFGSKIWPIVEANIRAICICLEAGVAHAPKTAAPDALNKARKRAGRWPLNDFHLVSVMPRARNRPAERSGARVGTVRLHFRRGHWRLRGRPGEIWIKWCLVGNPDLGFIDKAYCA